MVRAHGASCRSRQGRNRYFICRHPSISSPTFGQTMPRRHYLFIKVKVNGRNITRMPWRCCWFVVKVRLCTLQATQIRFKQQVTVKNKMLESENRARIFDQMQINIIMINMLHNCSSLIVSDFTSLIRLNPSKLASYHTLGNDNVHHKVNWYVMQATVPLHFVCMIVAAPLSRISRRP